MGEGGGFWVDCLGFEGEGGGFFVDRLGGIWVRGEGFGEGV